MHFSVGFVVALSCGLAFGAPLLRMGLPSDNDVDLDGKIVSVNEIPAGHAYNKQITGVDYLRAGPEDTDDDLQSIRSKARKQLADTVDSDREEIAQEHPNAPGSSDFGLDRKPTLNDADLRNDASYMQLTRRASFGDVWNVMKAPGKLNPALRGAVKAIGDKATDAKVWVKYQSGKAFDRYGKPARLFDDDRLFD